MPAPFIARSGPWLFDRRTDLLTFGGSAVLSLGLLAAAHFTHTDEQESPPLLWLFAVLLVDVAHVWATLFRLYLDPEERRRHRRIAVAVPLGSFAFLLLLRSIGSAPFWTVMAYLAVFHFVRQQVGFLRLYRRREKHAHALDGLLDDATVYTATLYPVLWWHAHLPRNIHWLIEGDFLALIPSDVVPWIDHLGTARWLLFALFAARQFQRWHQGEALPGKALLVASTALCWHLGIITFNGDVAFTVTNVFIHGVPYLVLNRRYANARSLGWSLPAFVGLLWALAYLEELGWDQLVWHDHPEFFGPSVFEVPEAATIVAVAALSTPQFAHYLLDGILWRRNRLPAIQSSD